MCKAAVSARTTWEKMIPNSMAFLCAVCTVAASVRFLSKNEANGGVTRFLNHLLSCQASRLQHQGPRVFKLCVLHSRGRVGQGHS